MTAIPICQIVDSGGTQRFGLNDKSSTPPSEQITCEHDQEQRFETNILKPTSRISREYYSSFQRVAASSGPAGARPTESS